MNPRHRRHIFIAFCFSSWIAWLMDAGSSDVRQQDINRGHEVALELLCITLGEKIMQIGIFLWCIKRECCRDSASPHISDASSFERRMVCCHFKIYEIIHIVSCAMQEILAIYSDYLESFHVTYFFIKQTRNHFWIRTINASNFDGNFWRVLLSKPYITPLYWICCLCPQNP